MSTSRNNDLHLLVGKLEWTLESMQKTHDYCKKQQEKQVIDIKQSIEKIKNKLNDHEKKETKKHYTFYWLFILLWLITFLIWIDNEIVQILLKKFFGLIF